MDIVGLLLGLGALYIIYTLFKNDFKDRWRCGFTNPVSIQEGSYYQPGFEYNSGLKLTPAITNLRFGGGHLHRPHGGWNDVGSFGYPYYGGSYPSSYYDYGNSVFTDVGVPWEMIQNDQYLKEDRANVDPQAYVKAHVNLPGYE